MTGEFQLPLRSLAVPEGGGRPYPRKITIPDERGGHLDRPRLVRVATPTRQRLTVLKASAGFGKTALLAKCCRSLVEQSIPTAWVSLDEGDDARVLDTCIRAACDSAGLKLSDIAIQRETGQAPSNGVALVAHTLETFAGPFVLAIDDVDLLHDQESIALLDLLFNRGPPNLHMAITCRELPAGLNVGGAYLEGSALVLDTENLRFSSSEIANFLEKDVPRPKSKNALAGWPIAVQIARNKRKAPAGSDKALDDSVANWMDSRLFGRLAVEDRDLLLNIGQFEWMDAGLLNDVLGIVHSPRRIGDLPGMRGLLMPVTGDACDRWELHLLVRQHCVRRLFKDAPERFIKIHHSLAKVLSQRGETVSAARHAIQAGKTALAGEILEDAGVADVRLRQGLDQFIAADRLLNEKIMSNHPRLRFFHSLGWALSGRLGLARENYSVAESMLETHADDGDLALDGYIVRNDIALCGGERVGRGWIQKMRADLQRLGEEAKLDSFTLGHLQFRLAAGHQLAANFDAARDQAVQAREKLDKDDYAHAFIDLEIGQVDMAQGRAEDAERRYSSARQANLKAFAVTRQAKANAKILLEELALECNRLAVRPNLQGAPRVLAMTARSFSTHAAAIAIAIAMALRHNGAAIALSAVGILMEFFRDVAGSPPLVRYISAQKVFLLVMAGQVEDAAREWRLSDLPEEPSECLDLSGQSWREMEALSCARLRLLAASRQFDQARDFAADLRRLTAECGLRRTLMRALSQSVALERQAGDDNAAMKQLERFLKLFGETRYALPMAWDYQINAPVVKAYVDTVTDSPAKEDALSLLAAMRTSRLSDRPLMNTRELQVLDYLGTHQDKEIARILGLSPFGVRYHIRKIFAKLGACTRADADRRARELGLLVGRVENER